MTDYKKWKNWLDQWRIEYDEMQEFNSRKFLVISGWYAAMFVNFKFDTEEYLGVTITDG